ncbi:MAG: M48 family metallopeptidase, partial [Planctomycetota bacterium]
GGSERLSEVVADWSSSFYLQLALYLIIFSVLYYLVFVVPDFYGGFVLEHSFGLSNQTVWGWLGKSVKKGLLSLLLLLVCSEALYLLLRHFPDRWWLLASAAWLILTIVIGRITPTLIIPLFYKCGPLCDTDLKKRLLRLGERWGVRIREVFEVRLSKETRKANAAVAGLGKSRRILLGDTLIEKYSSDEIEAVFAHELGHIRRRHIMLIIVFATAASLVSFYLTFLLYGAGTGLLGFERIDDIGAFPLLALILMVVGLVLMPVQLGFLRHLERQADTFALAHIDDPERLASALVKLAEQNLIDPTPSRLEELLLYDHPPISKRLSHILRQNEGDQNG